MVLAPLLARSPDRYLGTAIRAWPILVIQVDLQYSVSILITGRFVLPIVSDRYLVSQPQKPGII